VCLEDVEARSDYNKGGAAIVDIKPVFSATNDF
jgi:hypothetical protein